ncbi:MAG: hypothetical protein JW716_05275 [Candidatus Aenigmarchaeota archaeon]|nr:hypothetical protein [Candidatus Aenigmarchaeota archaeon]
MILMNIDEMRKADREISKEAVANERSERSREKNHNAAIGIVALVIVLAFLYFFVITSTFVMKPILTKPALTSPSDIGSDNVNWMLNEVGSYKLHSYMMFGGFPVIESVITDQNRRFTTTVRDNYPTTVEGASSDPDIRFSMNSTNFMTLYAAPDILAKAQEMRKSGLIEIEILKDEFTMALKGYKAIYDSLPG